MSLGDALRNTLDQEHVVGISAAFAVLAAVMLLVLPDQRARIRRTIWLYVGSVALLILSVAVAWADLATPRSPLYWTSLMLGGAAMVNLAGFVVFDAVLGKLRVPTPRIASDLILTACYLGVGFNLLSRAGVSLSGIVTTSAVLTAVIGFSMQDTLGNIFGGLLVQLDKSIGVGDWIKVDQTVGKISEIRWRHTAIETRNWETVIIPNSVLMKSQVTVLGRRSGAPLQWRRWIYFNVDFRYAPSDVIAAVDAALQAEPIARVAAEPKPHCIFYDFKESYGLYAVRYWLLDLAVDDPTDSVVRTRIYFALKRAGIPLSIPAASVFLTQEDVARKELKHGEDLAHRLKALARVELFHSLTADERRLLAERMRHAPFAKGEAITRQGAAAHWLYIMTRGAAEIDVSVDGAPRRAIATLKAGDFFGEMSLMTGAPRSATVIALEDTECYRIDKEAFRDILHRRPEIAEQISLVLARRETELAAAHEGLDAEAHALRMKNSQHDFLRRISDFFGLHRENGAKAAAR
ncbi:MAG: mechanosensitive ion channel family protein [Verrucomicrobiota bacterium]